MKILFTGASSFTGFWFVRELTEAGHEVTAIFQKSELSYEGVRALRVKELLGLCSPIFSCSFGSDSFLKVIEDHSWDIFCHHASDVTDYKSPAFNWEAALHHNTFQLSKTLPLLKEKGCRRLILTGSVFEPGEGAGSDGLRAVSPYGLSKGLTAEVFRYYCAMAEMPLGKFVIPNPFGPYEEKRFTSFLMETWWKNETAAVKTPAYVRDNIPVSLLARAYRAFVESSQTLPFTKHLPSGYVETQGEFTKRFAIEMRKHLSLPCDYVLHTQVTFSEPEQRYNTEALNSQALKWDEAAAWSTLAHYYKTHKDLL